MINEGVMTIRVKLSDVTNTLEQKSITMFAGSSNELIELPFTRKHIGITLVSCKVDSQSNKFFSNDGFGAMDNQLVN